LSGSGLAIAIYSCDFIGDENGKWMVAELQKSSDARAVYAAAGTVYFQQPALNERPTVTCDQSWVLYSGSKVEVHAQKFMPVFDI
jgi:hypothetical protein